MDVQSDQPHAFCRLVAALGGIPRVLAITASLVAVALAVGTGGAYNPELAVLTATLVAVIWYAYFTFRVAYPPARITLRINPDMTGRQEGYALRPEVKNTTDRRLYARVVVRLWIDGEPVRLGAFYQGNRPVTLEGGRSMQGVIPLKDHTKWAVKQGHRREILKSKELLVSMRAEWIDSLCEKGRSATLHWYMNLQQSHVSAVADPERISETFGSLPDPYASGPEGAETPAEG